MEHCERVKNGLSPLRYENTCVACSTKCNALWVIFFLICDNFTIINNSSCLLLEWNDTF